MKWEDWHAEPIPNWDISQLEDDDMRYKDWSQEDKMLLSNDVADAVVERFTNPKNENEAGGRIKRATHWIEAIAKKEGLKK